MQLDVRYEDYGDSNSRSTPNWPLRYAITDNLTFRGSVQTTFRGPDLDAINESRNRFVVYVGPTAALPLSTTLVTPTLNLKVRLPITQVSSSSPLKIWIITVDYWNYDFDNPIVSESFNGLVSAYAAGGDAKAAVQAQIYCTGGSNDGSCAASGIERIESMTINGPSIETSGLDFYANYQLANGCGDCKLRSRCEPHTKVGEQDAYL